MKQIIFNLEELLRNEVKSIFIGDKPYKYNLINNDTGEKSIEGIQKQKKLIEGYLIDNNIPKMYKKEAFLIGDKILGKKFSSTIYYEGFYIEGYKIKYSITRTPCYFKHKTDYHIENKYISSKLNDIYLLLKDKFDIVPKYTNITGYINNIKDNQFKFTYNTIQYLEISKDKTIINTNIDVIDNIENNLEDFILEYV